MKAHSLLPLPFLFCLFPLLPPNSAGAAPPAPRRILEARSAALGLSQVLASADAFRPYPRLGDRPAWNALPEAQRRVFVGEAEKQLATEWAILPATRFMDYVRNGNRRRYESLLFSRRARVKLRWEWRKLKNP